MRAYILDEISPRDMKKIDAYLGEAATRSGMSQVYWIQMPDDLLSATQYEHTHCRPHVFAVELGRDWIKLEFFVRSLKNMRCTCPAYCSEAQRNYIINFAHTMIERLSIRT